VWVTARFCSGGAMSVRCSDQALTVLKAAAMYQKFEVFALEVFDRFKANACQLAGASAL
jgi:hypothetical protein